MINEIDLKRSLSPTDEIVGEIGKFSKNLCFDSRLFKEGEIFFALKGETHDAFDFVDQVMEKNCDLCILELGQANILKVQEIRAKKSEVTFVMVANSTFFLQTLCSFRLERWRNGADKNIVMAITGSNGKTTSKEMISFLLERLFPKKILKTEGNFNNHLGVPMTLCRLEDEHQVAVIEMGTNHPGEVLALCEIAKPDSGLITNIGAAHLEFFKSEEGVFEEKSYLFNFIKNNPRKRSLMLINNDDKYLSTLPDHKLAIRVGKEGDYQIEVMGENVSIKIGDENIEYENMHIKEKYNVANLALAVVYVHAHFPERAYDIALAASQFEIPEMNRSQWKMWCGKRVFLDAYNANPSSMRASIESFTSSIGKERGICILGDMNELGEKEKTFHCELGRFVSEFGVSAVFIGRFAKDFSSGYRGEIHSFATLQEFRRDASKILRPYNNIMIKGSNSLHLESILDINID